MTAIEKIDLVRQALIKGNWLINPDRPYNPYAITAAHFDAMGSAVTISVFSDMQGRFSTTLTVGGIGITLNDRLFTIIDVINVQSRTS